VREGGEERLSRGILSPKGSPGYGESSMSAMFTRPSGGGSAFIARDHNKTRSSSPLGRKTTLAALRLRPRKLPNSTVRKKTILAGNRKKKNRIRGTNVMRNPPATVSGDQRNRTEKEKESKRARRGGLSLGSRQSPEERKGRSSPTL